MTDEQIPCRVSGFGTPVHGLGVAFTVQISHMPPLGRPLQHSEKGGSNMSKHPLKIFKKLYPELLGLVGATRELALADSALPKRFKLLIAWP